jgi:8-oxo-dGTP diphosphatase
VTEFTLRIEPVGDGVAVLTWDGDLDPDTLLTRVRSAADEAFASGGWRRLELSVPPDDAFARRAAVRSGFRLEGVRRAAHEPTAHSSGDLLLFGRLSTDVVLGPTGFSGVMNAALPRKRLIAHVLMRDPQGRILLCETRFKSDWELPGGIVEPGEPPRVGAVREVREELGIDLEVGRLLIADWMPPYLGWDDALELIFDGGVVEPEQLERYTLQPSEIVQIRLCTLDEAGGLVTELSHRRLTIATSLAPQATAYLENGSLPEP